MDENTPRNFDPQLMERAQKLISQRPTSPMLAPISMPSAPSPGGVVDDTLAIYDIMRFMTCDIATYCIGRAESGGAIVFMAGRKGKRFILPNAKVMIHQPFGGVYGQAADIEIQAEEILKTKDTLIQIMSKCTGQSTDRIREDSERDRFFDAKQAVSYGICDEILGDDTSMKTVEAAADATKPK